MRRVNGFGFGSLLVASVVLVGSTLAADDTSPPPVKHRVILTAYDHGASTLMNVSAEGKEEWRYPVGGLCVMFQPLPDGHIVFAHHGAGPTGVREIDADRKTVFDYIAACPEVLSCERLPTGETLAGEEGPCRVASIDAKGNVASAIALTTHEAAPHRQLRCFHRLDNGHILSCHEADAAVREVDADGKVVWEYDGVENVFEALRLPSGNTLIGCGTQKRIIEVTADKKIVWEFKSDDAPDLNLTWITSLQVLKNGDFVIANFLRGQEGKGVHAFEVTHDKKVVWTFANHAMVKSLTMLRVIDGR